MCVCACACACADAYTDVCLHIPYKCLPEFQKEKWIIWWLHLIFYLFSSSLSRALINYKNQCPQFLTLLKQGKPQIFPTQATLNFNWGYAEIQFINVTFWLRGSTVFNYNLSCKQKKSLWVWRYSSLIGRLSTQYNLLETRRWNISTQSWHFIHARAFKVCVSYCVLGGIMKANKILALIGCLCFAPMSKYEIESF